MLQLGAKCSRSAWHVIPAQEVKKRYKRRKKEKNTRKESLHAKVSAFIHRDRRTMENHRNHREEISLSFIARKFQRTTPRSTLLAPRHASRYHMKSFFLYAKEFTTLPTEARLPRLQFFSPFVHFLLILLRVESCQIHSD